MGEETNKQGRVAGMSCGWFLLSRLLQCSTAYRSLTRHNKTRCAAGKGGGDHVFGGGAHEGGGGACMYWVVCVWGGGRCASKGVRPG